VATNHQHIISNKSQSSSSIRITYGGSSFIPLAYVDGYVTRYSANIQVHFDMQTKKGNFSKNITAIVEENIQASSLTSSTLRIQAIAKGLEKALDEFVAYISAKGILASEPSVSG